MSSTLPDTSTLSQSLSLNQIWHQFKNALICASQSHFPVIKLSLMKPKAIPHEIQPFIRLSHSLAHFIMSLKKLSSITRLSSSWSRFFVDFKPAFLKLFPDQINLLNVLPEPIHLDTTFTSSNLIFEGFLQQFRKSLRSLKKFISARITLEFDKFKTTSMKSAILAWNINFYENKGKFICSSLN